MGDATINSTEEHSSQNNSVTGLLTVNSGAHVNFYGNPGDATSYTNTIANLLITDSSTYVSLGNGVDGQYGTGSGMISGGSGEVYNNIGSLTVGTLGGDEAPRPVVDLSNNGSGIVINTDDLGTTTGASGTGTAITVQGNAALDASNQADGTLTNFINTLAVKDNAYVWCDNRGSNDMANHVSGDTVIEGGSVYFKNSGSAGLTNTFGSVTINGNSVSHVDFANHGTGMMSTTIDTLNIVNVDPSGYGVFLGGNNNTTQINTLNWNGGMLSFLNHGGSWGNTTFTSVNITGPVVLGLYSDDYYDPPTFYGQGDLSQFSGTLFTVTGTLTGAENITLVNNLPFVEINGGSSGGGASVTEDGVVHIVATPVATTLDQSAAAQIAIDTAAALGTAAGGTVTSQAALDSLPESNFATSPHDKNRMRFNLQQSMRTNAQNPLENLIVTMAEGGSSPHIIKDKGNYRLWTSPYTIYTRNTGSAGSGTGFTEKDYGMLLGGSTFIPSLTTGFSGVIGCGFIKRQMSSQSTSYTNGKQFMMGLTAARHVLSHYDWMTSLYGVQTKRNQYRQGHPSANQSYTARASYITRMLSVQNELGRVFKLHNGYSIRPLVGVQMAASKRNGFNERMSDMQNIANPSTFAQRYQTKTSYTGEAYTGMGLRKKWDGDRYEGKITTTYEVGQKSGNGKARTDVAAGNQALSITSTTPGRFTQYLNLYGSLLDKRSKWKFIPSATVTLQKGQRSLTSSMKVEYRF